MKATKSHSPPLNLNPVEVIAYFEESQRELLGLLKKAERADLAKIRVPISISRIIRLKLGDTFRFLIAHQQRHFVQIQETLAQFKQHP
jgi:hypothetical protein